MANFAIIRVEKLQNFGAVSASAQHTFRERDTPNADPQKKHLNEPEGSKNAESVVQGVRDRILSLIKRKDSVVCLEYMISASPEAFQPDGALGGLEKAYFDESLKFIKQRHGAENVVCSMIHNDEKTPHMCVYVVPVVENRLSAKHYCGGRKKLADLQTHFAKSVALLGVDRGKHRMSGDERRDHVKIAEWYAQERAKLEAEKKEIEALRVDLGRREAALADDLKHLERVSRGNENLKAGLDQREKVVQEKETAAIQQAVNLTEFGKTLDQRKAGLDDREDLLKKKTAELGDLQKLAGADIDAAYAELQVKRAAAVAVKTGQSVADRPVKRGR